MIRLEEKEAELIFPFWGKLKKGQKDIFCTDVRRVSLTKGERIAVFGNEHGCFIIRRGVFAVMLMGESDTETELCRLGRQGVGIIDFPVVCGREVQEILYRAVGAADIYFMDRSTFSFLLNSNAGFKEYVLQYLVSFIPSLIASIGQRDYHTLDRRIIDVLLAESVRQRSATVSITHNLIASKIGSAREAVTRKLRDYTDEGLITCQRGKITLNNKERLKRRAGIDT